MPTRPAWGNNRMLARATAKYVRMSPRKIRYVMGPLRLQTVAEALRILSGVNRRACAPVAKAIASAFANAKQTDSTLAEDQVVISRLTADGGPYWKRFRAAAFGRAMGIQKPTAHIRVELERKGSSRPPIAQPVTKPVAKKKMVLKKTRTHGT